MEKRCLALDTTAWVPFGGWLSTDISIQLPTGRTRSISTSRWAKRPFQLQSQKPEIVSPLRCARNPQSFYGVQDNPSGLAETLGIDVSSIGFEVAGKKIATSQVVSTSSSRHLLVPVANEEILNSIQLADRECLAREFRAADPLAYRLYLFTARKDATNQGLPTFVTQFFSPGMSGEDPATGSAAGPMSAYLHRCGIVEVISGEERNVKVLQGLMVGRACVLTVTNRREEDNAISIRLSGNGVDVDLRKCHHSSI